MGTNKFFVFDENRANLLSDQEYQNSDYRKGGAVAGIAPSNVHNKMYLQSSTMAAAIAQVIADTGKDVSDFDFNLLVLQIKEALVGSTSGWRREHPFNVSDISTPSAIGSYKYMECTVAGTTGATEPTWPAVGETVTDGSVTWIVRDVRAANPLLDGTGAAKTADIITKGPWVDIRAFGAHTAEEAGYENFDNHDAILAAVDATIAAGGGIIKFPVGTIKTSPISFSGRKGSFELVGSVGQIVGAYSAKVGTTLMFTSSGSVGLQFAPTTNPYAAWDTYADNVKITGIHVNGNHMVDVGINANNGVIADNVSICNCNKDGFVVEDYGYPVRLKNIYSYFNGRHGLYVRGPKTTVLSFDGCEFSSNGGYGICMEGGAGVTFLNCLCQSNVTGGVKLSYISGYTEPYYFEDITFINFYTEANGTRETGDALYEGNFAAYITSYDKTANLANKVQNVKFIGGAINEVATGGQCLKIDACSGCYINATVHGLHNTIANVGVLGLEFSTKRTIADLPIIGSGFGVTSYYRYNSPVGIHYNCGLYPKRGRTQQLFFYVNAGQLVAGGTCRAKPSITIPDISVALSAFAYPVFRAGCLYGLSVRKITGIASAGTVTVTPMYGPADVGLTSAGNTEFGSGANLTLTLPSISYANADFDIGAFPIPPQSVIGVKLTASEDYVVGAQDGYIITMLVEF